MKATLLLLFITLVCSTSCTKSKNQTIGEGTYAGASIFFMPLAPPNDSVGTTITLTISGNHFTGTSDTTKSPLATVIGGGTYTVKSGHITFTQDSTVYQLETVRSVLAGEYDLLKTGDSLVFVRIPAPGLLGAGPAYFRLRIN